MKNKSKLIITSLLSIVLISGLLLIVVNRKETVSTYKSSLAVLVEGNNGYEAYSEGQFLPGEGYVFNSTDSYCEDGSTLSYDSSTNTLSVSTSSNPKCYIYFDLEVVDDGQTLADYILENETIVDSGDGLYHHTNELNGSAADGSYRFAVDDESNDINNWLCFGESDGTSCSNNHKWRIVGIMPNGTIKIVGNYDLGQMAYDSNYLSWNNENNEIRNYLNGNDFLYNSTYMSATMRNMLVTSPTWNIGAVSLSDNDVYEFFEAEQSSTSNLGTVGLLNASDYGYSLSPDNWSWSWKMYAEEMPLPCDPEMDGEDCEDTYDWIPYPTGWLWVFNGSWTLSEESANHQVIIGSDGMFETVAGHSKTDTAYFYPVVFLKANVKYVSGTGAENNMYVIE